VAGAVRHLVERDGRYWARLVVPTPLRPVVGRTELRQPLGGDKRLALRKLPGAVAGLMDQLSDAEAKVGNGAAAPSPTRPVRPLEPIEMARVQFSEQVAIDDTVRDIAPHLAGIGIDDRYVADLKQIAAGRADDPQTMRVLADVLIKFGQRGQQAHAPGSPGWRQLTRLLAQAELAALNVIAHRDEGEPDPPTPAFLKAPEVTAPVAPSLSIGDIFEAYRIELQRAGKGLDADRKWPPIIGNLITFLRHDDPGRITRKDAIAWKDKLGETFAPKTVRDRYLATAKAAFSWAVDNDHVASNPFAGVKVKLAKRVRSREKGFNDQEAVAILKAASTYAAPQREHPKLTAAKRWTPWLAAYTGARIGELTQLREEDVRERDGVHYVRLTPEAGTVKSGEYRDVPLHLHLIELGFLEFVKGSGPGPLFLQNITRKGRTPAASTAANKVAAWVRTLKVADEAVAPNHGWRHRLKTVAGEVGMNQRVVDAIQGHAPRTAGENYGDVTLKTMAREIEKHPRYTVGPT
jgi:integrase